MSIGLLSVILSSILFGLLPAAVRQLQNSGVPSGVIVFWTYFISLICYILAAGLKEKSLQYRVTKKDLFYMFLTGAAGMGLTSFLLTSSYHHIPTGTATLIHFTYPVIVTVFTSLFFHEPFTGSQLSGCILSILGLLFVTGFTFSSVFAGIALAFLSAVTYSTYLVVNDKAGFCSLPVFLKMVYLTFGSVLLFYLQTVSQKQSVRIAGPHNILLMAFIGLSSAFAFGLLTYGIKKIGSSRAAFAAMLEPVTSVICGVIFWRDNLSLTMTAGIFFILCSMVIVNIKKESRFHASPRTGGLRRRTNSLGRQP